MQNPEYGDHPVFDSHNLTGRARPGDLSDLIANMARLEAILSDVRRVEAVAADHDLTYTAAVDAALDRLNATRKDATE